MGLDGQRHLVVGGATGWGRAVSQQLANEGAHVLVVDDDATALQETRDLISKSGGASTGFVADIGDYAALVAVSAEIGAAGMGLRSLVTHYMALDWHSVEECDVAEFERVVAHNLVGPVKATKAFLPLLRREGKGAILHLGSVDGLHGNPRVPSYSAAKGGLVPLTKIMSFDFARYDIRVNAIATAQTVQISEEEMPAATAQGMPGFPGLAYARQLNAATPLKRYGPLTDWAKAATFLVSDASDYITGTVIVVDCGRLAVTPGTA